MNRNPMPLRLFLLSTLAIPVALGIGCLVFSTTAPPGELERRVDEHYGDVSSTTGIPGPAGAMINGLVERKNREMFLASERGIYREEVWMWRRIPAAFALWFLALTGLRIFSIPRSAPATPQP